jgi:hypothetical protein
MKKYLFILCSAIFCLVTFGASAQITKVAFIKEPEEDVNVQIPQAMEAVGCEVTLVDGTNYEGLEWSEFDIIYFSTISITNPVGMNFSNWMEVKDKIWSAVEGGSVAYIGHHDDVDWNGQVADKGFLPYETRFFEMPQGFEVEVLQDVEAFSDLAAWEATINDAPIDWAEDYEPLAVAKDNPEVGVLIRAQYGEGFILISAVDDSGAGATASPENIRLTENLMRYFIDLQTSGVNPLQKLPLTWGAVKKCGVLLDLQ